MLNSPSSAAMQDFYKDGSSPSMDREFVPTFYSNPLRLTLDPQRRPSLRVLNDPSGVTRFSSQSSSSSSPTILLKH